MQTLFPRQMWHIQHFLLVREDFLQKIFYIFLPSLILNFQNLCNRLAQIITMQHYLVYAYFSKTDEFIVSDTHSIASPL